MHSHNSKGVEMKLYPNGDGVDQDAERVSAGRDEQDLMDQGKRQQFNRNFGFLSLLGFATTMMCTWEAVFFANSTAMLNGGSPALIWGFLFSWVGNLAVAASLAELSSIAPTSGGQYHWVAMLCPPEVKNFVSWITGWVATIGWNANTAAGIFFSGTIIQGLLVLNYPEYNLERWQGTLLMYAALLFAVFVNTVAAQLLPKIEGLILIVHTLGFFAILIPLVYLSQHNDAHTVFATFVNSAGWESNGLAFFVGLISTNLPFIGYDGPAHMSEEVRDAARIVPKSMVLTVIINGVLGFAICIAFGFCVGVGEDLQNAIESPTGYDFIYVFYEATQSHVGTSIMSALLIALVTCAAVGFLATASRQTFAFARDQGLPGSNWLSYVSDSKRIPLRAVGFCTVVTAVICLINIGSTVAFNAIVSLTLAGLDISYLIPITLMVINRFSDKPIRRGPWSLGRLGLATNIVSIIFLIISVVFSFFPPGIPITLLTMNWSCVVFGGFVIIGLVYYALIGRKVYQGPIWEI